MLLHLAELVSEQPKVRLLELGPERRGRAGSCQRGVDGGKNLIGLAGPGEHMHAARGGQIHQPTWDVRRRIEHDGRSCDVRIGIGANLPDQLIAIHPRHHHVGDNQIGMVAADERQRLFAVRRFKKPVPARLQQCDE